MCIRDRSGGSGKRLYPGVWRIVFSGQRQYYAGSLEGDGWADWTGLQAVWGNRSNPRHRHYGIYGFHAVFYAAGNTDCLLYTSGTATTALPVIKAAVSQNGIVAAILEDSRASYIQYYKKDGTDMQLTVKSVLSGDGYPLDIALSPDGTRMIASIIHLEKGELLQRVVTVSYTHLDVYKRQVRQEQKYCTAQCLH